VHILMCAALGSSVEMLNCLTPCWLLRDRLNAMLRGTVPQEGANEWASPAGLRAVVLKGAPQSFHPVDKSLP
jgi:hypothetical protein